MPYENTVLEVLYKKCPVKDIFFISSPSIPEKMCEDCHPIGNEYHFWLILLIEAFLSWLLYTSVTAAFCTSRPANTDNNNRTHLPSDKPQTSAINSKKKCTYTASAFRRKRAHFTVSIPRTTKTRRNYRHFRSNIKKALSNFERVPSKLEINIWNISRRNYMVITKFF